MKNLGYYNGAYDEMENMKIPMSDRVCFFGDGVYDATYSRNYKIFAINEHVDRFYNSAKLLHITIPLSKDQLINSLYEMLHKMDSGENFVYFQVTRGVSHVRIHAFPEDSNGNLWINIFHKEICDVFNKAKLMTLEDTRFLHCNIKTINLIPSVIASQKAKELGYDETVFHRNGRVTECAHSNVHILKSGAFITAPLDNLILPGITRKHLINICNKLNIPVYEKPFMLDELMTADEIIISSAGQLCTAVEIIDGKKVGNKSPALLKTIQDEIYREFLEETD